MAPEMNGLRRAHHPDVPQVVDGALTLGGLERAIVDRQVCESLSPGAPSMVSFLIDDIRLIAVDLRLRVAEPSSAPSGSSG
jgi:hypothetical protein